MRVSLALIVAFCLLSPCGSAADGKAPITDASASPAAKRLYTFLQSLEERESKRLIVGQVFDKQWEYKTGFGPNVVKLHDETGKWVAMLHSWLDYPWLRGKGHLSSDMIYPLYRNFHHRGAVLMLLVNPYNPWSGLGIHQDKPVPKGHFLSETYTEGNPAHRVYREYLDNLADNLDHFAREDIPIIIRLYGENNGRWFWFHHGAENVTPEEFRTLWTYTVRYLRETRGLHNLLFCYEVTENRGDRLQGLVPEHSDILGIQCGRQPLDRTLELYEEYLPYGKPIMMPQFLPHGKQSDPYDNLAFAEAMVARHPKVIAFSPWFSNGKRHAIVSNPNAKALMNHPWAMTLDDTGLATANPPNELPVPRSLSDGTTPVAPGPFVWNFDGDGDDPAPWSERSGIVFFKASDGRLNLFYHGEYPSIRSAAGLGLNASELARLRVRMRNHSTSTRVSLRWITDADADWNTDKMAAFTIEKNTLDYGDYTVDLGKNAQWKETIAQIAFFPALDSVSGSAEIDYIAFETAR
jgi:hypothetical protein